MYKKVVVPLDGSKLAELALPHLEEIGKGCSIPEVPRVRHMMSSSRRDRSAHRRPPL